MESFLHFWYFPLKLMQTFAGKAKQFFFIFCNLIKIKSAQKRKKKNWQTTQLVQILLATNRARKWKSSWLFYSNRTATQRPLLQKKKIISRKKRSNYKLFKVQRYWWCCWCFFDPKSGARSKKCLFVIELLLKTSKSKAFQSNAISFILRPIFS